ncbi:MAG: tautomerase family protein, partial [Pseudomonadota bacterium]
MLLRGNRRGKADNAQDNQFITIIEHDASNFRYGKTYLDIERSDDVVFIQISAMQSRTIDQKKA